MQRYEYKTINSSHYPSVEEAANAWAQGGWRTVSVVPAQGVGYAHALVLERELVSPMLMLGDDPYSDSPPKKRKWWNPRSW